jgi:transposase
LIGSPVVCFGFTVYDFVMGQSFLPDTVNQTLLFPPSLHEWLPDGHLARFLVDVVSALDLEAIYASYREKDGRGQSAYAPEMMVRLLLYGYATGVYSSRKIETRTYEDVAFRYLSGDQHPDHATLAEFRKRHLTGWPDCLRRRCCCAPRRGWSSWAMWLSMGARSRPAPASTRR